MRYNVWRVGVSYSMGGVRSRWFDTLEEAEKDFNEPLEWDGTVTLDRYFADTLSKLMSSPNVTRLRVRDRDSRS